MEEKSAPMGTPILAPTTPVKSLYRRFDNWRTSLGLPNPGIMENLGSEAKLVHLTSSLFSGGRADFEKVLSRDPHFQVSHSFALGSQGGLLGDGAGGGGGQYNFAGVFATQKLVMQGVIDHSGTLNGLLKYGWTPSDVTKAKANISKSPMMPPQLQIEHDRIGLDYTFTAGAVNPSLADGTGIYTAAYLQSVTKNLALGFDCVYQKVAPMMDGSTVSYSAKYTGSQKDWIATAQLNTARGVFTSSYWQKISERVEAAAELEVVPALVPTERKALATVGAKYDFRTSSFRSQVDSKGRIYALLEQRFTPVFIFQMAGMIDHWNNSSKFGVGIQLQSAPAMTEEDFLQSQQQQSQAKEQ